MSKKVPDNCIVQIPGMTSFAILVIMPDGSKHYAPITEGTFHVSRTAEDTHIVTFDSNGDPIVNPSSKLHWSEDSQDTYTSDYIPELP